jgi:hypothetical protein
MIGGFGAPGKMGDLLESECFIPARATIVFIIKDNFMDNLMGLAELYSMVDKFNTMGSSKKEKRAGKAI